jgi:hypothetical protein
MLAAGPAELDIIYEHVPRALQPIVLGPKPRKLGESIRLLARNLDWYLRSPAPLMRPVWLMFPMVGMVLVLLLQVIWWGTTVTPEVTCILLTLLAVADTVIVEGRRRYAESVRLLAWHIQRVL